MYELHGSDLYGVNLGEVTPVPESSSKLKYVLIGCFLVLGWILTNKSKNRTSRRSIGSLGRFTY
jgi:hypothetical protein